MQEVQQSNQQQETRQRIIDCGRKEFLEKDYQHASLRNICKAAGVTTGAFYFWFENKEALLRAILDPVVEQFTELSNRLAIQEMEQPQTAVENDRKLVAYEYKHKEELIIIMEHSEGSCYEDFKNQIQRTMEGYFRRHFTHMLGEPPNEDLIRILAGVRMQSNLAVLKGNYDMEYTLYLTEAIGTYADGGTESLINWIKETAYRK